MLCCSNKQPQGFKSSTNKGLLLTHAMGSSQSSESLTSLSETRVNRAAPSGVLLVTVRGDLHTG